MSIPDQQTTLQPPVSDRNGSRSDHHPATPGEESRQSDSRRNPWLNLAMVGLALIGIVLLQILLPGKRPLVMHGITDEIGHLLTAFIFAVAARAAPVPVPVWAVLIGGVILDTGHIPDELGITHAIAGSSRNGSHSLLAVALIAAVALGDRQRVAVWLGIALGALSHLWRDMGTGTVPLGWPLSHTVQGVSYGMYVAGISALAFVAAGVIVSAVVHMRSRQGRHLPGSDVTGDAAG